MNNIYYRSQNVIKEIYGKSEWVISEIELNLPFATIKPNEISKNIDNKLSRSAKKMEQIDNIDKSSWQLNEFYKFSGICEIKEEFTVQSYSKIKVKYKINDTILSGYTSFNNWISESYLNNFLSLGKIKADGILILLGQNDNLCSEIDNVVVQYILIGKRGILC